MTFGITGNTNKEKLWQPLAQLIQLLQSKNLPFRLYAPIIEGLVRHGLFTFEALQTTQTDDLTQVDLILSFGGDGTIINTARLIAPHPTPILGINIGRLGFLADIEVAHIAETISMLEKRAFEIERRLVLEAMFGTSDNPQIRWALNEFVLTKGNIAKLVTIHTQVNDRFLCDYWADGLIIATPTGSTAYSLSAGGPIIMPGSRSVVLTPIAPHTLTMRPIILPESAIVSASVDESECPFILATDGQNETIESLPQPILIRRAAHDVLMVSLPQHDYFKTLRNKLGWGVVMKE